MSITTKVCVAAVAMFAASAMAQQAPAKKRYDFGSVVTESDLKRFTSPLPDGRGLPAGSGTVVQGRAVYVQSCASCHGEKLEGGIGDKLVGGRGTLVNTDPTKPPVKTVESYWPYATTLFDYIKRSMPFNAPGTLTDDQVYAVSAYILSQAKIVGDDATLDAKSLAAVRMPNRDGFIPDPRPEKFPPPDKAPHSTQNGG
ncbi:MAG: c-type cytochrome [Burkholderiaceae bacterium]